MQEPIPMLDLKLEYEHMKADIDAALARCLEHQRWILGPEVNALEEQTATYLDAKHCVGTSSGTEALVLALRSLAILRTGQEFFNCAQQIITTPFTFTATGDAILRSGATPVFVDIDPVTFNIDLVQIKQYLEKNSEHVIGILPVHLYGRACDMDAILSLAEEYDLFVVEDVAQAFGGSWKDKKLGSLGDAGAFSFFPSKNLGGFGDGGLISTNNGKLADLIRMLIKHGGKDKYNVDHIGYNARIDTIQAAVVLGKMNYLDEFNRNRCQIAEAYNQGLAGVDGIVCPTADEPGHVYHQYTIRVENDRRNELQDYLKENSISTMIYYPYPLHKMKVFGGARAIVANALPETEDACKSVLSLPIEPLMEKDKVQNVVAQIKEWISVD